MNYLAAIGSLTNQGVSLSIEPTGLVTSAALALLILAVGLALAFEFVNGFHDTANAVATVIYTRSLRPWVAVIWSGLWNLLGVLCSGGAVAFGVLALLPVEMVLKAGSTAGLAMVFALLLSAIIWNLGTWYLGLPASSTHSLFGAIVGVGLANALMSNDQLVNGVNWIKLRETLMALLISPIIGFVFAGLLLLLSKLMLRWPALFKEPSRDKAPPLPIRALLVLTCTSVSFGHGSNDGQKGMGLVLLILIGILPGVYALNPDLKPRDLQATHLVAAQVQAKLLAGAPAAPPVSNPSAVLAAYLKNSGAFAPQTMPALIALNQRIVAALDAKQSISELSPAQRSALRGDISEARGALAKLSDTGMITDPSLIVLISQNKVGYEARLDAATNFIPFWVKLATALALGLGTMIGWKRIVVTVGEKIGKSHLTYAQGASAELVAAATIQLADLFHLPVSTTHVLSSGVAGTMAANKCGLQMATLRNLLLAWVLTLPVCMLLGAALFAGGLLAILHNLLPVVISFAVIAMTAGLVWKLNSSRPRRPASAAGIPSMSS